jgi:hypothetical protein
MPENGGRKEKLADRFAHANRRLFIAHEWKYALNLLSQVVSDPAGVFRRLPSQPAHRSEAPANRSFA